MLSFLTKPSILNRSFIENNYMRSIIYLKSTDLFFRALFSSNRAGNLRAQPYVQYGSDIEENMTITWSQTLDFYTPIIIRNVTVESSGNWVVMSTYNTSSPFGTHSEIVVRPETHFAPTGTNVVHLVVN